MLAAFDEFDRTVIHMNTEDCTKFARDLWAAEKATIERPGLSAKA